MATKHVHPWEMTFAQFDALRDAPEPRAMYVVDALGHRVPRWETTTEQNAWHRLQAITKAGASQRLPAFLKELQKPDTDVPSYLLEKIRIGKVNVHFYRQGLLLDLPPGTEVGIFSFWEGMVVSYGRIVGDEVPTKDLVLVRDGRAALGDRGMVFLHAPPGSRGCR